MNDEPRTSDSDDLGGFISWLCGIVGLVVIAAVFVGHAAGADGGSYADWIAAMATVAAFGAAGIAGWFAHRALRVEQTRDKFRDEQLVRAQAELVAAWMAELDGINLARDGKVIPTLSGIQYVHVRNASQLPVTNARMAFTALVIEATAEGITTQGYELGVQPLDVVPPTDGTESLPVAKDIVEGMRQIWLNAPERSTKVVQVAISFFDTGGRGWIREADGRLLPQPDFLADLLRRRVR